MTSRLSRMPCWVLATLLLMLIPPQPSQAKLQWLVKRIASRHPEVLYFADTRDSVLALTIDDSPDSATTPQLLEVLREYDVHATFFVITDQIPGNEPILRQPLREGHEIGNHQTRDERSDRMSPDRFVEELRESHRILAEYAEPGGFARDPDASTRACSTLWPSMDTGALSDRCTPSTRLSGPSASPGASSSGLPIREGSSSSTTVAPGESGLRRSCVRCCLN